MHVYLVARATQSNPPELQINVQGLVNPTSTIPELTRLALHYKPSKAVITEEMTIGTQDCVFLSWNSALIVAHPAYPSMPAVDLLKRIDAGHSLITVLHLALNPAALVCHDSANECVTLMRENLERAVKRQNGIGELLVKSNRLSRERLTFRRHRLYKNPECCCSIM